MQRPDSGSGRQLLIGLIGRRQSAFRQRYGDSIHRWVDGLDAIEMGLDNFAA